MALADRIDSKPRYVYVVLGDGESQEGQVWEAAEAAGHFQVERLIAFLDYNRLQLDGPVCEIMSVEPLQQRWQSFGWHVQCVDGHDVRQLLQAIDVAKRTPEQPHMIIASTVKGKGVSYMEGKVEWHAHVISEPQYRIALEELQASAAKLALEGGL
jgi:transketolase